MSVLQFYATSEPMRSAFLRMNGITHAEVWDTEEGYQIAPWSAVACASINPQHHYETRNRTHHRLRNLTQRHPA